MLPQAERHARNAVRIAPTDAQSHNLMGMIMTEAHRPQVGEHHYRRAMKLVAVAEPDPHRQPGLEPQDPGANGRSRGRSTNSPCALDPTIFQTLYGWSRMEETDRNFVRAGELLDAAEQLSPGNPSVLLQRAILHGRAKNYDKALAVLDDIDSAGARAASGRLNGARRGFCSTGWAGMPRPSPPSPRARRLLRELSGQRYQGGGRRRAFTAPDQAFFVAPRLEILPLRGVRSDVAQPIFIVGFPRSGTTMIGQTRSAHPLISAGDELPILGELTGLVPRMLNSPLGYPEAFADLWLGDQMEALDNLARFLSSARPPAWGVARGRELVYRQDAAQ